MNNRQVQVVHDVDMFCKSQRNETLRIRSKVDIDCFDRLLGWTWFELGQQDCTQWNVTENHEKLFTYHETITISMKNQPRVGLHCLELYGCTWY